MLMPFEYDIFISYSHKDEQWVSNILLPALEQRGLKVCIDYRDFIPGRPAIINMQDASEASRHTLLVLTPRWMESEWTLYESIHSRTDDPSGLQRRTIPILLEKCTPPKFISMLTWVDFTNRQREKEAWNSLFNSLQETAPVNEESSLDTSIDGSLTIGSLPPGSYLPFTRNALFTGRQAELQSLADKLLGSEFTNTVISQALTGMGGIGKTQLAVEFAYRYGYHFKGVHWLDLHEPQTLDAAIALCGTRMGVPYVDPRELVAATLRIWVADGPRLLILDNFEDVSKSNDVLARFQDPSLRLLITSRRLDFPKSMGLRVQELGIFSEAEGSYFLEQTLEQPETVDARRKLAEKLGHLPLALELAAHYINIYKNGIDRYVEELGDVLTHESMQAEWFKELEVANPTRHDQSLFGTFQLSWQEAKDVTQQQIFNIAGYCAPNTPIPLEIFKETLELEEKALLKATYRLNAIGLLPTADGLPTIHPLLGAYARRLSSRDLLEKLAHGLAELARHAKNHHDQTGNLDLFVPLRSHVLSVADFAEKAKIPKAADLLGNLGHYLLVIADLEGAKAAFERALKIDEATFGSEHHKMAVRVNDLGLVLHDRGLEMRARGREMDALDHLQAARADFERALRIDEATLGPDHSDVARDVNNLGRALMELGELQKARVDFERALRIDEAALGPDHPHVARDLNNLGLALYRQGNLEGARSAYERALQIGEATLGPEHFKMAIRLNNLGGLLQELHDLAGARVAFERALAIFNKALPGHPHIQRIQKNLDDLSEEKEED
jgi:tetratricopeptide (TPR) repeat protein